MSPPNAFRCDRCANVIEGKPYMLMQRISGRCVQDAPSCFIHDLCESCAREAKKWVSEPPARSNDEHAARTTANR